MPYVDPNTVISPKKRWTLKKVIINTGQGGWSLARGIWDKGEVLAIRWNGSDDPNENGMPISFGYPVWFILPNGLMGEELIKALIDRGQ